MADGNGVNGTGSVAPRPELTLQEKYDLQAEALQVLAACLVEITNGLHTAEIVFDELLKRAGAAQPTPNKRIITLRD